MWTNCLQVPQRKDNSHEEVSENSRARHCRDRHGRARITIGTPAFAGAAIGTTPGPGGAPALLFHGTADPLVPYAWAQATVQAAKAAGLVAILVTWVGAGHVPYLQHRTQILNKTTNFFFQELDLAHASGVDKVGLITAKIEAGN